MGTLTVNATNGQTVAAGASYTVSYPAGKSAADYLATGAKITTSDGSIYSVTVSLGGSSITITNPTGREIASGGFDYLDLNNAGIVARFGANGESDVLLGPQSEEVKLVSSTTNPLTGKVEILPTIGGGKRQVIRAAIEAAARSNALLLPAHSPAPLWQASKVYYSGQIVRSIVAGSTNNLYLAFGSVPFGQSYGTSAGSGGPSGIGPALITDNTICWEYIGASTSTGTFPLESTVVPTTSTDVTNGYLCNVLPANLTAMGLTQYVRNTITSQLVSLANSNLTDVVTLRHKNAGSVAAPFRPVSSGKSVARFTTNAKKWIALKTNGPMYQYTNAIQAIKVNGQLLSECGTFPFMGATDAGGGAWLLDVSRFPSGDKHIEIFIQGAPSTVIFDTYLLPEEVMYPTEVVNDFKIAIEGDSVADMTYGGSFCWFSRYEFMLSEMLGATSAYNNCIGGTSIVSNSGGAKTNYMERLDDIILFQPDLLIISGTHNDVGLTQGQMDTALWAYLNAVRAALPNVTICIQGGNCLSAGLASQQPNETRLKNSYNAWPGDKSNTLFVDVLNTTPNLILSSATGYYYHSTGVPSGYTDGHPCFWYYKHLVPIVANAIRKFYRAS